MQRPQKYPPPGVEDPEGDDFPESADEALTRPDQRRLMPSLRDGDQTSSSQGGSPNNQTVSRERDHTPLYPLRELARINRASIAAVFPGVRLAA
jgi:hypothetical protein